MDTPSASELYFCEGIAYYNCAEVLLTSFHDVDIYLQSMAPIDYLFRHAAELMLKALIIRGIDDQCIPQWESYKLPPENLVLSRMHSLKTLAEAWRSLYEHTLFPIETLSGYSSFVEKIEAIDQIDFSSTFFRYPLSKDGVINEQTDQVEIDEAFMASVPCSLGACLSQEGPDNFRCYHLKNSGLGLCSVVEFLIKAYTGEEILDLCPQPEIGGLL